MKELRIVGPLHNPVSGYGKAARALLAAAICAGYRVEGVESETDTRISVRRDGSVERSRSAKFGYSPRPQCQNTEMKEAFQTRVSESAPTIIMQPQNALSEWPEYCSGPRIGLTMTEAEGLNPLWARAAQNVDLLLVPSLWNLELFNREVPVPCELLPLCVDERLWSPDGPRMEINDRPEFLFLAIFSTCERKHWRSLIQAFSEEFPGEDVGLLLKPSHYREVEELAAWSRQRGVWIGVLSEDGDWWSDEQMASLYRAADCYALPSAEGFGVPFIEAALCGLPVVGLGAGGSDDFVCNEVGVRIDPTWEPCVGHLPGLYRSNQSWPSASVPEIRKALRQAYDERRARKGVLARHKALCYYTRELIGALLDKKVETAIARWSESSSLGELGHEPPSQTAAFKPGVVVVITTYNHIERTQALVFSLLEHGPDYAQIVIVDDGSTDGTVDWCRFVGCFVIETSGHNVARSRNLALDFLSRLECVDPTVVVFMDNDIEVTPGWWSGLREVFEENPYIGILSPAKMLPDGTLQNTGNRLSFAANSWEMKLDRALVWPDYVETACMAVRPEVWRDLRFDEQFEIFYEDVDYCFQARQLGLGWETAATNRARVVHHAHTTTSEMAAQSEARRFAFLRKWKECL